MTKCLFVDCATEAEIGANYCGVHLAPRQELGQSPQIQFEHGAEAFHVLSGMPAAPVPPPREEPPIAGKPAPDDAEDS